MVNWSQFLPQGARDKQHCWASQQWHPAQGNASFRDERPAMNREYCAAEKHWRSQWHQPPAARSRLPLLERFGGFV